MLYAINIIYDTDSQIALLLNPIVTKWNLVLPLLTKFILQPSEVKVFGNTNSSQYYKFDEYTMV